LDTFVSAKRIMAGHDRNRIICRADARIRVRHFYFSLGPQKLRQLWRYSPRSAALHLPQSAALTPPLLAAMSRSQKRTFARHNGASRRAEITRSVLPKS